MPDGMIGATIKKKRLAGLRVSFLYFSNDNGVITGGMKRRNLTSELRESSIEYGDAVRRPMRPNS